MHDAEVSLDSRVDILTGHWARSELLVRLQEAARSVVLVREYLEFHEESAESISHVVEAQNLLAEVLEMNLEGYGVEVRVELNRVEQRLSYVRSDMAGKNLYTYVCSLRRDIHAAWSFSRDVVDVLENINV